MATGISVSNNKVYFGPDDTIYPHQNSSVGPNESVTILWKEGSWYYIEYYSGSYKKRMYIQTDKLSSISGTVSSKTIIEASRIAKAATVYCGPGDNSTYVVAGSVDENEAVTYLSYTENSYSLIEYSITGGQKKRAYISSEKLSAVDSSLTETMSSDEDVYYGAGGSSIYAKIGTLDAGDNVKVIFREGDWFMVEYLPTGATTYKRGFVPKTSVSEYLSMSMSTKTFIGYLDTPNSSSVNVYSGPSSSKYFQAGTVSNQEGVTVLNYTEDDMLYIEYSTSSGAKRGFVSSSDLQSKSRGVLGVVSEGGQVYSGPDTNYFNCGAVGVDEYVIILQTESSTDYNYDWYFIEYNTSGGRKRGYVDQNKITPRSVTSGLPELSGRSGLAVGNSTGITVFYGPGSDYQSIGAIDEERVSVLTSITNDSTAYSYIEYFISSGTAASKRGYVKTSDITTTTLSLQSIPTGSYVTEGSYGTSAMGQLLKYYKIGYGSLSAFVVFGVHAFEDCWAADGEELYKIARNFIVNTIQNPTGFDMSKWSVYVIPMANPDGLHYGWTNNGPGRTTVNSPKIDLNRSFPTSGRTTTNSRRYNTVNADSCVEMDALKNFILQYRTSGSILIDVHGWLNQTYGNITLGAFFTSQFGFSHSSSLAGGYLSQWGVENGMDSLLLEFPVPASPQDILDREFSGKFNAAMTNLLNSLQVSNVAVTGVSLSPSAAQVLQRGSTTQLTAVLSPSSATNKSVTWNSSDSNIVAVSNSGLITGKSPGTAIITVTTNDGGYSASISVNCRTLVFEKSEPTYIYSNYPEAIHGITGHHYTVEANITAGTPYTVFLYHKNETGANSTIRAGVAIKNTGSNMLNISYTDGGALITNDQPGIEQCQTIAGYRANGTHHSSLTSVTNLPGGECAFLAYVDVSPTKSYSGKFTFSSTQDCILRIFHCSTDYAPFNIFEEEFTQDEACTGTDSADESERFAASGLCYINCCTIDANITAAYDPFMLFEYKKDTPYPSQFDNYGEYEHKSTLPTTSSHCANYLWGNFEQVYKLQLKNVSNKYMKLSPQQLPCSFMTKLGDDIKDTWVVHDIISDKDPIFPDVDLGDADDNILQIILLGGSNSNIKGVIYPYPTES